MKEGELGWKRMKEDEHHENYEPYVHCKYYENYEHYKKYEHYKHFENYNHYGHYECYEHYEHYEYYEHYEHYKYYEHHEFMNNISSKCKVTSRPWFVPLERFLPRPFPEGQAMFL